MKLLLIEVLLILALTTVKSVSPQEQYYRGIYDLCVFYGLKSGHKSALVIPACLGYTNHIKSQDWYGKDSPGWQWPLKDEDSQ